MLSRVRKIIPKPALRFYHFLLSFLGALIYRFPSRQLRVIAVTGTKGKTSTSEYTAAIFEAAGEKVALTNTIRFKLGDASRPNRYKMTLPGRFFLQKFLREAVDTGCTTAVIEMTSEGAVQSRHRFIELDGFILTNIAPEHIESHGSYENYVAAKVSIAKQLARSTKEKRVLVVNGDDKESSKFLLNSIPEKYLYTLKDAEPYQSSENGISFTFDGTAIHSPLPGTFTISNMLAGATMAKAFGIETSAIKKGLESVVEVPGRIQKIEVGQNFTVVVDYAHTPDSLRALYEAFKNQRKICVLGNTGGGRDTWKRALMGEIADSECAEVILTDEDPYDENPNSIIEQMVKGMKRAPKIIMDRREAIHTALTLAKQGDAVLITGKGTDPYIMGPNGTKTIWSDSAVAKEELEKLTQ